MSGIQTFKYKRKKLIVIFWNNKVWFKLKEISVLIKCSQKDDIYRLSRTLTEYMPEEDKHLETRTKLVSASGLQYLVERVTMKPQRKAKLKDFYDWIEKEVKPVFDEYIKSWL